jgi:hypothetical protein
MKIYQSPLSLGGILLLIAGLYLIIVMLKGAWPTYFSFIFLGLGIAMLVIDYFIRKSGLEFSTKLIIQSLCTIAPLLIGYLFFAGKI